MDINTKIDEICEIQKVILSALKSAFDAGIMNVDSKEAGEVSDILKDLSETEKNIREAEYYKLISEAMKEEKEFPHNQRYGYSHVMKEKPYMDAYLNKKEFVPEDIDYPERYGYSHNDYGVSYDEYKNAKRHYTETKSLTDRDDMEKHAKEHFDKAVMTIKEIWNDTPVSHKSRMKDELTSLAESLPIM